MKVEAKSAVILLITLALGAAIGMLGQGAWQRGRQQQLGALRGIRFALEQVPHDRQAAEQRNAFVQLERLVVQQAGNHE